MRLLRTFAPIACLLSVAIVSPAGPRWGAGQRVRHITLDDAEVVCRLYLDPHDKFTRVGPPQESSWRQGAVFQAASQLSTITVNYTGFTGFPAAQASFQAAVDIWSTQVSSSVPIVINATFTDLGGAGGGGILLGQAGPNTIDRDFPGNIRANTWFPGPIANSLSGVDLDGATPEIGAKFNSNAAVNWYFGTDGLTPSGHVDFESVVLHELGHGLGFLGVASVSGGTGTLGVSGFPLIYDTFTADSATAGTLLVNYPNPSAALGTAFTSNSIFWAGANGVGGNSGARPKLYAPATFSQGSTYSHLDEATYPAGNMNSLMTPFLGMAEAVHSPGPIMLGMFKDMGWTVAGCTYSLSPAGVTIGPAARIDSVSLTTQPDCAWTASSANTAIATITSAPTGSSSATINYSVNANIGSNQRSVNLTIGGQTFTITQNGTGPTMTLDKSALVFAAVSNGAAFTAATAAQVVRMTQTGSPAISWTAQSNSPWLLVSSTGGSGTSTSGSGSATLTISTQFVPGLAATQIGTITIALTGAGNSVGPISVRLNSIPLGTSAPPFGSFDSPNNNTTGVAGSIAVTGWALDDVQVTRLTVCRDPVTGEAPAGDPRCAGNANIYIGDAVFVDGARTDVQAAFPGTPLNSRAGWGYLLLSNFLPNLGNGTVTLRAYAFDADGHTAALGSKTITCNNDASMAPFGAIDEPGQGEVVSGAAFGNVGWVLARGPNFADPPDGGTVTVFVDGAIVGSPGAWNARPDLQLLFPAAQYPGINLALGIFGLNTTVLTNGVHTIFWLATGTGGSGTSGIGSRFFTVSNGSELLDPGGAGTAGPAARTATVIASASTLDVPRAAAQRIASPAILASEIAAAPADLGTVQGRRGFDLDRPLGTYTPSAGRIDVQAEELDRVELHLGGAARHQYTGYLRTSSGLRPLPVGSSLDASTGVFTWMPGVGFYGAYDLTFVRWSAGRPVARQDVRVTLNAKGSNRVGPQTIIDVPGSGRIFRAGAAFFIGGWAADLDSPGDSGVSTVHVWAYPVSAERADSQPIFLGQAFYGGGRPDVAAIYGDRFGESGYGMIVDGLPPGTYDIAVFAYSTVRGNFTPARVVRVVVR